MKTYRLRIFRWVVLSWEVSGDEEDSGPGDFTTTPIGFSPPPPQLEEFTPNRQLS